MGKQVQVHNETGHRILITALGMRGEAAWGVATPTLTPSESNTFPQTRLCLLLITIL